MKPHSKNQDYYSDLPSDKYAEVRRSIETHGIRDPLKILPDYTVIAGHQRLKIARELGLEKVPVEVLDISAEEAEYLLIADNEERRQADDDPIRKAKRAKFLKDYWEVRRMSGRERLKVQNAPSKTLNDVAEAIGEGVDTTKRLLKLNDLIKPFQDLVSAGKLGQTATYSLAFLPVGEQEKLLDALGESGICGLSVKQAQELRAELDSARKEQDKLQSKIVELEEEKLSLSKQLVDLKSALASTEEEVAEKLGQQYEERLRNALSNLNRRLREKKTEIENLRAKLQEARAKTVEKIVYQTDPSTKAELEAARAEAAELLREKEFLQARFQTAVREREKKEISLREAERESQELRKMVEHFKREVSRLKSKPRPKLDQSRANCHALIEKVCTSAFALTDALKFLEEEYGAELVSVARVRGGKGILRSGLNEFRGILWVEFLTCSGRGFCLQEWKQSSLF